MCKHKNCQALRNVQNEQRLTRLRSGVQRGDLACFILNGVKKAKPVGPISAEMLARTNPVGFRVPDDHLAREADQSGCNSLRLFTEKAIIGPARDLGFAVPEISDLGFVVRDGAVMVYRKR